MSVMKCQFSSNRTIGNSCVLTGQKCLLLLDSSISKQVSHSCSIRQHGKPRAWYLEHSRLSNNGGCSDDYDTSVGWILWYHDCSVAIKSWMTFPAGEQIGSAGRVRGSGFH